jgi:hypothetical protein
MRVPCYELVVPFLNLFPVPMQRKLVGHKKLWRNALYREEQFRFPSRSEQKKI